MIRKRQKGYQVRIYEGLNPKTGEKTFSYYYLEGATREEAKAEERRLLTERDRRGQGNFDKSSFAGFLERWLNEYARGQVSERTLQGYQEIVDRHVIPGLGEIPLRKLRSTDLQAFYADMHDHGRKDGKGGLSPQTILHFHRLIHKALGCAVRWGLIDRNPAALATPPKVTRPEQTALDAAQIAKLVEAARGTKLYALILTALGTGLRRGELLALTWDDVDLKRGYLSVRQSVSEANKRVFLKEPKTRKSRRVLKLPQEAVKALKKHQAEQKKLAKQRGRLWKDNRLVFPNWCGGLWKPNSVTRAFYSLVQKADIPQIGLHDLRHTHVTHLLLSGIPVKVVSERAGHSTTGITMDTYGHLLPGADEQAAAALDGVLRRATRKKKKAGTQTEGASEGASPNGSKKRQPEKVLQN